MSFLDAIWNWGRYNYLKVFLDKKEDIINALYIYDLDTSNNKNKFVEAYRPIYAEVVWTAVTPLVKHFYGDPKDKTLESDLNLINKHVLLNKTAWLNKFNEKINGKYTLKYEFKTEIECIESFRTFLKIKTFINNSTVKQKINTNLNVLYACISLKSFSLASDLLSGFLSPASEVVYDILSEKYKGKFGKKKELDESMFRQQVMAKGMENLGMYRGHAFGSLFDKNEDVLERLKISYKNYDSLWGRFALERDLYPHRVLHGMIGILSSLSLLCCCSIIIILIFIMN